MTVRSVTIALGLLAMALPASAQFVAGRVVEQHTMQPIPAATVRLRSAEGRMIGQAVTDSLGHFVMQASRIGEYEITAERIGYRSVTSRLAVGLSEEAEILLRMDPSAVVLEPLTVEARTPRNIGPLAGYYERIERNARVGIGTFITRDRIDERGPAATSDLLREVPRLHVERGNVTFTRGSVRGGCVPRVYVDGVEANRRAPAAVDDFVHPIDLEGVEVYQGAAQTPGEFFDTSGCGVIALWTRRGLDNGRPFSWRRLLAAAGIVSILALIAR